MIAKNFSGNEKVRNNLNHLASQPYSQMMVALYIVTPNRLGPAAQYGVNALNRSYCHIIRDDHTLRISKNKHKSIYNLFTSREVFNNNCLWNDNRFTQLRNLGLQNGRSTFKLLKFTLTCPTVRFVLEYVDPPICIMRVSEDLMEYVYKISNLLSLFCIYYIPLYTFKNVAL